MKKICKKHPKYKCLKAPRANCRDCKFAWQRKTRKWDDSDTWSLDVTVAKFVLPRLIRFKELHNGVPGHLCFDNLDQPIPMEQASRNWDEILDQMIFSFEYYANKFEIKDEEFLENCERIEVGLRLFTENFGSLWW